MSYPGNDALAQETKDRLLRTFSQTLDLAARGGVQEALLGCDFILRMDPLFQPARQLHDRLSAATGAVDVEDLRAVLGSAPAAPAAPVYGTVQMPAIKMPAARPAVDPQAVRAALQRSFDARDFAGVVALATQQRAVVESDPALQELAQAAQSHAEAEPYVRRFLDEARAAVSHGSAADAERLLQKVASLDPTHPELTELRQLASAAQHTFAEAPPLAELPEDLRLEDATDELSFAGLGSPGESEPPTLFEPPDNLELGALSLEPEPAAPAGLDGGAMPALSFPEPAPALTARPAPLGDSRIAELLEEGQAALDRGEYQGAIDAWSRIFLIDIDHAEAARRIEQARKLKAEAERQAEELFHEGVAKFEAGDPDGARTCFEKLLEQQPNHLAAREYMEQLEAGKVRVAPRPAGLATKASPAAASAAPAAPLKEEILVPPEPGAAPAKPKAAKPAAPTAGVRKSRAGRNFALIGLAVLVVAGGGGWYLFTHRSKYFPNSEPPAPVAPQQDAIQRATALHDQGKTAVAIAQLRRLPQDDPLYEKAQALIAQWQAAAEQPAPSTPSPAAVELQAKQAQLVADARAAYGQGLYLKAQGLFEQAAANGTLDSSANELLTDARKQTAALQNELNFMQQGEYEVALHNLWRLHETQRTNRDVTTLMVRAYYNLGVKDLQREAPADALKNFKEALGLDASDAEVQRLQRFAEAYATRTQDLQYRIFVKYLSNR